MKTPRFHQTAAKLAAAIYLPHPVAIRARLKRIGLPCSETEIINGGGRLDERAMVSIHRRVCYLVFCGTRNLPQWISNGNLKKRGLPTLGTSGFRVHRGFNIGLEAVYSQSLVLLRLYADLGYKIVLVGHSRGAAEATIAAQRLDLDGIDVAEMHLFGSPRSLNKVAARTFDRLFKTKAFRWIANNDAVARIPFRWMGYRHIGREFYFDSSDRLHINPSLAIKLRGQIKGRFRGGLLDGVSDHNAAKEYERLVGSPTFNPTPNT